MKREYSSQAAIIALLVAPFQAALPQADSPEELYSLCEELACYPPGEVRVNLEDGSVETYESGYPIPIVQGETIVLLFPGATVLVEGEASEDGLVSLRVAETPNRDDGYLELRMWQEPGESDTFLRVTNFYSRMIKYRAGMIVPSDDRAFQTSSCPVLGEGRLSYEHWPFPIFQLLLADFHFVENDDDSVVCE